MTEPPLSAGAVHERLIVVVPLAVAVRPVGASGTVLASSVVTSSTLEAAPVPTTELIAETR